MTTPPATTSSTRTAPLRGYAVTASVLVWVGALGPVAIAASAFTLDADRGTTAYRTGMALFVGGLGFAVLGQLGAAIAVIAWLRRARANAEALSPAPHRLGSGWAVGAWFVPGGVYFLPFMVVADVVRASAPAGRRPAALVVWWACWITAHLAVLVALLVPLVALLTLVPAAAGLLVSALVAQGVLFVVAAAAFTRLALQLAGWQDARIRA
jgi:Domain of unknown function (DUF4328)